MDLSEEIFKSELYYSRRSRGGNAYKIRSCVQGSRRIIEVYAIQYVEHLGAELQSAQALPARREVLEHSDVRRRRIGAAQNVAAGVSITSHRRRPKGRRIEPVQYLIAAGAISADSRSIHQVGAGEAHSRQRVIGPHGHSERRAGNKPGDSGKFPSVQSHCRNPVLPQEGGKL